MTPGLDGERRRLRARFLRLALAMRAPNPGWPTMACRTGRLYPALSGQPHQSANFGGRHALRAQLAEPGGLRRFRELAALGIKDQPVVMINRRRPVEQNRSVPRTTWVTPCSASSITTER